MGAERRRFVAQQPGGQSPPGSWKSAEKGQKGQKGKEKGKDRDREGRCSGRRLEEKTVLVVEFCVLQGVLPPTARRTSFWYLKALSRLLLLN